MRLLLSSCIAVLLTLSLGGCSDTREVSMKVRGVTPLNPNAEQESTPVNVRVFALTTDSRFRAATVDQLWTDHAKALGEELLGEPVTFTVFPGNAGDPPVRHDVTVSKRTRFVGLLALYQRADAQDRRTLVVPVDETGRQVLTFTGVSIALAGSDQ